jgi:CRISPR-associated endonuclease/helicase Cas3
VTQTEFKAEFQRLTGNPPLLWQVRLWEDHFTKNNPPNIVDLPTGLGKTMVMAIWLIARMQKDTSLPRRLIYVVDRRTVVDQATIEAVKLQKGVGEEKLAISTLRGQLADNREWAKNPSRLAIIIGTVDMIGSRLLFSGYGVSPKCRSIDAGLLGQDSLIVLDEAHLSPAFSCVLTQIHETQAGKSPALQRSAAREPRPMQVLKMSATHEEKDPSRHTVFGLEAKDNADPIVNERINAVKRLHIRVVEDVRGEIIAQAKILAERKQRIIIFVRSPDQAQKIGDSLKKTFSDKAVDVLTGTMRGKERQEQLDDTAKHPVFNRLLSPVDPEPHKTAAILVSTAAGEVGVDFNADHLICDLAPIDSLIQRLGRVNRRGKMPIESPTQVHLYISAKAEKKPTPFDEACAATLDLLNGMPVAEDGSRDASPLSMRKLAAAWNRATSPKPVIPALTDILLDAWSMTSIRDMLPGRPMVDPWLRGIDENETPHTTVVWRRELDYLGKNDDWFNEALEYFPIKPHEQLNDRTDLIVKGIADLPERVYNKQALIIGAEAEVWSLQELAARAMRSKDSLIRVLKDKQLVLPASIGGIDDSGLFSGKWKVDDSASADVADIDFLASQRKRVHCILSSKSLESEPVSVSRVDSADDIPDLKNSKTPRYFDSVVISRDQEEEPDEWFAYFSAQLDDNRNWTKKKQFLDDHVAAVMRHAKGVLESLSLDAELSNAILLSAQLHDTGKGRDLWQTYARRAPGEKLLGKSNRYLDWRELCGFRHEFGSLCDADSQVEGPYRDLILHLVAAHHGYARPHFENTHDPGPSSSDSTLVATGALVRFPQLQRTFGRWGLAWLESILRCADQQASAEVDDAVQGGQP